jgi:hypothetical protein
MFKIFRFPNDFITQKVYFSQFASYWSAGFGAFLQLSALSSHLLEDCANIPPTPEEND